MEGPATGARARLQVSERIYGAGRPPYFIVSHGIANAGTLRQKIHLPRLAPGACKHRLKPQYLVPEGVAARGSGLKPGLPPRGDSATKTGPMLSPIINLILLLAFTYFIGGLIISAINEALSGAFRQRPRHLKEGLENLFFDPAWKEYITKTFLKSPFIESLLRKRQSFPAYIPARNFAQAVVLHCNLDQSKLDAASVINAVNSSECLPQQMKEVIRGFITEGQVSIRELEKSLEDFYDNAMQRVSGWYTRFTRRVVFILSFIMAASLNIDTLKIVGEGLSDKQQLEQAANNIVSQVSSINGSGNMNVVMNGDTVKVAVNRETLPEIDSTRPYREVLASIDSAGRGRIREVQLVYQSTTGQSIGYLGMADFKRDWGYRPGSHHWLWIHWGLFWKKLIGLLLTSFALQLGSAYWFGVLNKVVSIRAAGIKPEEKKG